MGRLGDPAAPDPATRARLEAVRRYAVDAVIEDLERAQPEIVVVDLADPYVGAPGFDYLDFFGTEPRFRSFWRDYVKVERIAIEGGRTRRFDIYCRRGSTPGCPG